MRRAGRPRAFDADAKLRDIYATFRRDGFSGASLDDLAHDTGLSRPSLYAAFGDKRAMYLRTLELVTSDLNQAADRLEALALPLEATLEIWFSKAAEAYLGGRPAAGGCLALCTAAAEAVSDEAVRDRLREVLTTTRLRLQKWFEAAGLADHAARADLAAALMHSLSLRARAGEDSETLNKAWRRAVPLLVGTKSGN